MSDDRKLFTDEQWARGMELYEHARATCGGGTSHALIAALARCLAKSGIKFDDLHFRTTVTRLVVAWTRAIAEIPEDERARHEALEREIMELVRKRREAK